MAWEDNEENINLPPTNEMHSLLHVLIPQATDNWQTGDFNSISSLFDAEF